MFNTFEMLYQHAQNSLPHKEFNEWCVWCLGFLAPTVSRGHISDMENALKRIISEATNKGANQ